MSRRIWVLRLTHRVGRDKRVTTHLALVARAFGAQGMYYSGDRDVSFEEKVRDIVDRWGGSFQVLYVDKPVKVIDRWREAGGLIVHLTMYGVSLPDMVDKIRENDKILVIVGSEKVEPWVFKVSDYNISITNQPHSEIAALAVFLDYYFSGEEFGFEFPECKYKVIPMERGKKVVKLQ